MTTAQLVFIYTAEELNISKAASRAFISQQCASNHIKNLEEKYGIALFNRRPCLSLTTAGESLLSSLRQLYVLEKNMDARIQEIRQGSIGQLKIGLNSTRARILIPEILSRYSQQFPQVKLSLHFDDTFKLLQLLESGKVDLVIGIGIHTLGFHDFSVKHLSRDSIYFITTPWQILKYQPSLFHHPRGAALSIHDLVPFPFCRNLEGSTLTKLVDSYLYQEDIQLDTRYYISDYDTQISMCSGNVVSAFCPSMILKRIFEHNLHVSPEDQILIFPIKEITDTLPIELIQNSTTFLPLYVEEFIKLLSDTIVHMQDNLEFYL